MEAEKGAKRATLWVVGTGVDNDVFEKHHYIGIYIGKYRENAQKRIFLKFCPF